MKRLFRKNELSAVFRTGKASYKRLDILYEFITNMSDGHPNFIRKIAFGPNYKIDFALALTKDNINIVELESLYDKYWLEFDGYYKRSLLKRSILNFQ